VPLSDFDRNAMHSQFEAISDLVRKRINMSLLDLLALHVLIMNLVDRRFDRAERED
jgi:hypothetical protein